MSAVTRSPGSSRVRTLDLARTGAIQVHSSPAPATRSGPVAAICPTDARRRASPWPGNTCYVARFAAIEGSGATLLHKRNTCYRPRQVA